jgi:LAS superfamily LD-carboxypeptidase LdcB
MTFDEFVKKSEGLSKQIETLTDEVEECICEAAVCYAENHKNPSQDNAQHVIDCMSKAKSKTYEKISLLQEQLTLLELVDDTYGAKFALKSELLKLIDQHYDMLENM